MAVLPMSSSLGLGFSVFVAVLPLALERSNKITHHILCPNFII